GAGTVIAHNLIRGNGGAGIFVDSLTPSNLTIANNLIAENTTGSGLSTMGGLRIKGDGVATGPTVDIYSNTVAHNVSLGTVASGVVVDDYATVTFKDNIVALNTDSVGAVADFSLGALVNITEDYNLSGTPLATAGLAGVNDTYAADPLFTSVWYLQNASPAINADALRTSTGLFGVDKYTEITTVDVGNLDLGYHHTTTAPANAPSVLQSTATPSNNPSIFGPLVVTITPKDVHGLLLGSGLNVTATLSLPSIDGESLSTVTDNGDGTYAVTFTPGAGSTSGTNTMIIKVNGVQLKVQPTFGTGPMA
ncbi:MAG: right-handed parallel beta-helix repeat-containing protein, partial [Mariprofundales bacterium]